MNKALKWVLLIVAVMVVLIIGSIIYRLFFQFDIEEIKVYAREEAEKYKDKAGVYRIIMKGVEHILLSHNLSQQVLTSASGTHTDKEQQLVFAAIGECQARKYLPAGIPASVK